MSLLAAIRGTTAGTGANVIYTFPAGTIDTTNLLNPGTPTAFDLRAYLYNQGYIKSLNSTLHLTVTIPSNTTLGSSSPSMSVLNLDGFHDGRDKITLINNGTIVGAGGAYGIGGPSGNAGSPGGNGGAALSVSNICTIINSGYIYGGGGGGGGGGAYHKDNTCQSGCCSFCSCNTQNTCGISGQCPSCCGHGAYGPCPGLRLYSVYNTGSCCTGSPAADTAGGDGGQGQGFNQAQTNGTATGASTGGDGGTYGANGTAGGSNTYAGGFLGLGGASLIGKSNVNGGSGITTGTVAGDQS